MSKHRVVGHTWVSVDDRRCVAIVAGQVVLVFLWTVSCPRLARRSFQFGLDDPRMSKAFFGRQSIDRVPSSNVERKQMNPFGQRESFADFLLEAAPDEINEVVVGGAKDLRQRTTSRTTFLQRFRGRYSRKSFRILERQNRRVRTSIERRQTNTNRRTVSCGFLVRERDLEANRWLP